jgi:hypothetical protein
VVTGAFVPGLGAGGGVLDAERAEPKFRLAVDQAAEHAPAVKLGTCQSIALSGATSAAVWQLDRNA